MVIADFCAIQRGRIIRSCILNDTALFQSTTHKHTQKTDHALLMLHGFSSSPGVFRNMIPRIQSYDMIIAPLLPGHGISYQAFSQVSHHAWLEWAIQTYDHIAKRYQDVSIVGSSLGGLLGTHIAQHRDVHTLYLLAPAFALTYPIRLIQKLLQCLSWVGITSLPNRGGDFNQPHTYELTFKRLPIHAIQEILSLIQSFKLQPFRQSTHVFLGQHDHVIHTPTVHQYMQNMPHTTLHLLKNAAHVLPLEDDAARIIDLLNDSHD